MDIRAEKSNKLVVYAALILCLICSVSFPVYFRYKKAAAWREGLITMYGRYETENGYVIRVSKKPKTLLQFSVQNPEGKIVIDSNKAEIVMDSETFLISFSVVQRWSLYWDRQTEYLWVDSSDSGLYVWVTQPDGSYIMGGFSLVKDIEDIPEQIRKSKNYHRYLLYQENKTKSDTLSNQQEN